MRNIIYGLIIVTAAATAFAADTATRARPASGIAPPYSDLDAATELKWDNGSWKYFVWWYTGADSWVGNDFDVSTLRTAARIVSVKLFTSAVWPNDRWDGFRVGIYSFDQTPGSMMWPTGGTGYFYQPTGLSGHVWVEVPVDWVTPAAKFLAGMEQDYDPPSCDPFAVDTNDSFRNRSWQSYGGQAWKKLETTADPYRNLMLRVLVDDISQPAVAPQSLGRVKALYY